MGLADHLSQLRPQVGCRTCAFYKTLKGQDLDAFNKWVDSGSPLTMLREACERDGLEVSDRAFRDHINNHHKTGNVK